MFTRTYIEETSALKLTGFFEELLRHGGVALDLAGLNGDGHRVLPAPAVVDALVHVPKLALADDLVQLH